MEKIFLGSEKMTVDNKGRVGIPARYMAVLRALCPDQAGSVGVMITPDRSIKIMPLPFFNQEVESWNRLNDQIEEERLLLNLATSSAETAPLDGQNRIKLSLMMIEECAIGRQVVVTGNREYMQIFDENVWREYRQKALAQYSAAAGAVARKAAAKAPVQYVINAGGLEPPAGGAPAR